MIKWAYGVTTIPQRRETTLSITLGSLKEGGFPEPRLFIDGEDGTELNRWRGFGLPLTFHSPVVHTYGNWLLALMELYLRDPQAERYGIFQDDILCVRNLREYLDSCQFPSGGYWNLYTAYGNEQIIERKVVGWHLSNQCGRGALALVFDRQSVIFLLTADHMIRRATCKKTTPEGNPSYWKNLDGGILQSFKNANAIQAKEWVHNPSLVQHIGTESSIGNKVWAQCTARSFLGKDFDSLDFLKTKPI